MVGPKNTLKTQLLCLLQLSSISKTFMLLRCRHAEALTGWTAMGAQVVTEQELVAASEQFEEAARGDRGALLEFCRNKAASSHGPEAETWSFLRIMFEEDPTTCGAPSQPLEPQSSDYSVVAHWKFHLGAGSILQCGTLRGLWGYECARSCAHFI